MVSPALQQKPSTLISTKQFQKLTRNFTLTTYYQAGIQRESGLDGAPSIIYHVDKDNQVLYPLHTHACKHWFKSIHNVFVKTSQLLPDPLMEIWLSAKACETRAPKLK